MFWPCINRIFRFLIFLVASSVDQVEYRVWQAHVYRPRLLSFVSSACICRAALMVCLQSDCSHYEQEEDNLIVRYVRRETRNQEYGLWSWILCCVKMYRTFTQFISYCSHRDLLLNFCIVLYGWYWAQSTSIYLGLSSGHLHCDYRFQCVLTVSK